MVLLPKEESFDIKQMTKIGYSITKCKDHKPSEKFIIH